MKTKKRGNRRFWAVLALTLLAAMLPAAAQGAKRWKTWVKGPGATWVQGCTYAVDTDALSFPPAGGTATVSVTTNGTCTWSVENVPSWVQASRQGATVTVTVGASATARGADLVVAGRKVRVNQEGTERGMWILDAAALPCDARGGYTLDGVDVRPNQGNPGLTWVVTVSEPWIQVIGGCTGSVSGEVTLLLQPNKTGVPRTGWIGLC
nr:BACON domain-containing protein [Acidobacteriota bacterium]